MKIYPIMFATKFPKHHSKAGMDTNFVEKIIKGEKVHTLRKNYDFWKERCLAINSGKAFLSLRYWGDQPYKSKQYSFMDLEKVSYQRWEIGRTGEYFHVDGKKIYLNDIALYDGLSKSDLREWFSNFKEIKSGIIIHFSKRIY